MARLKTFSEETIFTAADANMLALEVPPAATTQVSSASLSIADTANFGTSTTPNKVGRQGLQCVIEGSFITKTANYLGGGFRQPLGVLPLQYRPGSQLLWPVITSESLIVLFILGTSGMMEFRINGSSTHPANMHTYFSVAYSVSAT